MDKILTAKCGNCAHACLLESKQKHTSQLNVLFCSYWVETNMEHHSCVKFENHLEAGFMHFQNENKRINRIKYPLDILYDNL